MVRAGSDPRAARRVLAGIAAAALALAATGCGGSGSDGAAHARSRAADAAGAARIDTQARLVAGNRSLTTRGPHPVAVRRLTVARDGLYGEWAAPRDARRRMPAVVTFGGSNGGLTTTPFARALASQGYPALALAYFKEPGLPKALWHVPLEYFARAVRFVQRQPGVDPQRVVVMGASRGGEGALLVGATYPRLVHGVVALVPDYQTNGGWMLHGRLLPYDQEIEVERIRGPILTASGGRDETWSSSVYTEQIELRLKDHRFRFPHERLDFPTAGHGLRGTADVLWPRILRLLRRLPEAPRGPARAS